MTTLLPLFCSFAYRLTGCGKDGRFLPFQNQGDFPAQLSYGFFRGWGIPIIIALHQWNWIYFVTYVIALNGFSYGENYWIRKWLGRYPCWLIYGGVFGLASLNWWNGLWCAIAFTTLMHLSNEGIAINSAPGANDWLISKQYWLLDHSYVELVFPLLGTLIYLWR